MSRPRKNNPDHARLRCALRRAHRHNMPAPSSKAIEAHLSNLLTPLVNNQLGSGSPIGVTCEDFGTATDGGGGINPAVAPVTNWLISGRSRSMASSCLSGQPGGSAAVLLDLADEVADCLELPTERISL